MSNQETRVHRESMGSADKMLVDKELFAAMQKFQVTLKKGLEDAVPVSGDLADGDGVELDGPRVPPGRICPEWESHIKSVLFTETQIRARVIELAEEISRDYEGSALLRVASLLLSRARTLVLLSLTREYHPLL
jgi:hypothetical protein